MTAILSLPQFDGSQTVLGVSTGADWVDSFPMPVPGSSPSALIATGASLTNTGDAANVIGNLPASLVSSLMIGQPVLALGIPQGATLQAIVSSTSVQISAAATLTNAQAIVTFAPILLDISGISFKSSVKQSATDKSPWLTAKTSDGSLINGGSLGILSYSVQSERMRALPAGTYVFNIIAQADGRSVDLFAASGPGTLIVNASVS